MPFLISLLLLLLSFPGQVTFQEERSYTLFEPGQQKIKGNILFLNGWNMQSEEVCKASALCSLATLKGYRVIIPHMGKSVYASVNTPYTRADYRKLKKLSWITDSLFPALAEKGIHFDPGGNNHLMGLSSGARGAVLLAAQNTELFQSVILLSGDYDQCTDTSDLLMINTYGHYYQNPEVWQSVDNPLKESVKIKADVFIGHGQNDKVVKIQHSLLLEKRLRQFDLEPKRKVQSWFPENEGHDWKFWRKGIVKAFELMEGEAKE